MASKQLKLKSMRDGFGEALLELGEKYPNVVGLTADLGSSLRMIEYEKAFPERFIQVGIAEQNMAGVAAGLALAGKVPFIGSFSSFQPMRNLDQIRSSICIMNLNVKIVSSHGGFSYAADGIQIQALEDIAIMRSLPNMTVLVPGDAEQARLMAVKAAEIEGPVYLRIGRAVTEQISKYSLEKEIQIGEPQLIVEGDAATIFATGYMVNQARAVIDKLGRKDTKVVNIHTIKPLSPESILKHIPVSGKVITLEEHQIFGGLGGAVAEVVAQSSQNVQLEIIGVDDRYGQVARENQVLWDEYGLSTEKIATKVAKFLK